MAPGEVERLLAYVEEQQPSLVLFEGVATLTAMRAVRRRHPALSILVDMHNVESLLQADIDRARLPRPLRSLAPLIHRERRRALVEADRECAALATAIWTCSGPDAARLVALTGRAATVVPNPVPAWCAAGGAAFSPGGDRVLFLGHLSYPPNKRAVRELCSRILPGLRKSLPDVRLEVCGRRPGARLRQSVERAGYRLVADARDLASVYARAAVMALPLREGGGTRIKILEALAVGCPVVATAKAVEGLDLEPGRHFLSAETSREFVAALRLLLGDPARREDLRRAGRDFIEQHHSGTARTATIAAALQALRQPC
ncbi:glycosyltransferase family 4 protein [Pseudohoeflea coraliihabitans]|uniref:Glycosyltransferase family 4 protein n=1 Tax=Pseudohoeflea coraliihabitans TaxID=2860393 RepID=A0ABS6WJ88_9HYPH|nr:glycosyltransferase family 4 protein [Pseudohoeflea sp. DP4N28-3]MBW3096002.1 glycosyltransferase family 4 protein [Pseudohoeflea sp. DP4N28-3]